QERDREELKGALAHGEKELRIELGETREERIFRPVPPDRRRDAHRHTGHRETRGNRQPLPSLHLHASILHPGPRQATTPPAGAAAGPLTLAEADARP